MLIHKGEKPFECLRCQGRFRRRHHLMHHKCPSKDASSGVLVSGIEDGKRRGLDFVSKRIADASKKSERDEYEAARQKFSTAVGSHDEDVVVDDFENEEDASDMVVEGEDDDEVDHFVTSRRVVAHNNNGSVLEKKSRLRKPQEIRRVIRLASATSPPGSMIVTNPIPMPPSALVLPEQTEPEDLSMSTANAHRLNRNGYTNSHSSGDSRSPSSGADEEDEDDDDLNPTTTGLFLQHGHPKFRRHHQQLQRSKDAAPVS